MREIPDYQLSIHLIQLQMEVILDSDFFEYNSIVPFRHFNEPTIPKIQYCR